MNVKYTMEKADDGDAARFINALIKSVQSLCHGFLDFQHDVEIIGHINLSVDKENSLDYILKEKICRSAENSASFVSRSFQAKPNDEKVQTDMLLNQNGPTETSAGPERFCKALSEKHRTARNTPVSELPEQSESSGNVKSSLLHFANRNLKRKASKDQDKEHPMKVSFCHDDLQSPSQFPRSSSPVDSKLGLQEILQSRTATTEAETSSRTTNSSTYSKDTVDIGISLAGSILEPVKNPHMERLGGGDEDFDVTFIKEEHSEESRTACEMENSHGQHFLGNLHKMVAASASIYTPVSAHSPVTSQTNSFTSPSHASSLCRPGFGARGQQNRSGSKGVTSNQSLPGPSTSAGLSGGCQLAEAHQRSKPQNTQLESSHQQQSFFDPSVFSEAHCDRCPQCSVQFGSVSEKNQHVCNSQQRKKRYHICYICGRSIIRKQDFKDHLNRHRNIKAHVCPHCEMQFTFRTNFLNHMRSGVCYKVYKNPVF